MALGHALKALPSVGLDDRLLQRILERRHQGEALDSPAAEELGQRQRRARSRNAGLARDRLAEPAVEVRAEPAAGGAVPADGVDAGVRQHARGSEHGLIGELRRCVIAERNMGHPHPAEMRGHVGQIAKQGIGHRLQHRVERRRDHADTRLALHGLLQSDVASSVRARSRTHWETSRERRRLRCRSADPKRPRSGRHTPTDEPRAAER